MSLTRFRIVALLVVLAGALMPLIGPAADPAAAHPLGNFTVNRYARLELYRDAVDIHYVLDFAEIPTFQLIESIDKDGDGKASDAELDAYRATIEAELPQHFQLLVDGKQLPVQAFAAQVRLFPGQGGLDVLRVDAAYRAQPEAMSAPREVRFVDRNYEDRIGWKEIVVRPSTGAVAELAPALTADTSDALQSYPTSSLTSAPNVTEATFTWQPGTGDAAPTTIVHAAGANDRSAGGFGALLSRHQSLTVVLASLAAAFGFGMLHALGPGHGKTVVGAYLVGSKGTVWHAVGLGLTVTATHTSMVYLLGFVTIAASAFIVPERLYLYLGLASGASVVAMGLWMFVARLRKLRRGASNASGAGEEIHRHGLFGAAHSHMPAAALATAAVHSHEAAAPHTHEAHDHNRQHAHDHDHDHHHEEAHAHEAQHRHDDAHGHDRPHPHGADADGTPRTSWRGVFTLGVIGGALPCPSALLVMLAAISLGQVVYGMLLIVAFSFGLAGVLTGIGISLVLGRRLSRFIPARGALQRPGVARIVTALPAVSALGVAAAGCLITLQAVQQFGGS